MHIQFGRLVLLYICLLGLVAQGQVIQFPVTEKLDSILKIFRGDMDNLIEMQKNFIGRNEYENADNCSKLFDVANEAQMMGGQLESLLSLHQIIESEKSIKAYDKLFAKKTVQNDIKKVTKILDLQKKNINSILSGIKSPALALEGQRVRDHLLQFSDLLAR